MLGSDICARNAVDTGIRSTGIIPEYKYTGEGREGNGMTVDTWGAENQTGNAVLVYMDKERDGNRK